MKLRPGLRTWRGGIVVVLALGVVGGASAWVVSMRNRPRTSGPLAASIRELPTVPKVARPAPASEGFVGSAACAKCHPTEAEAFAANPMSYSVHKVPADHVVEDYSSEHTQFHPPGSRGYRVERDGDRVVHHEIMLGADRETIYDRHAQVRYAVGSGARGKSYLIELAGVLFMSPISWYSADGGRWDLSPGYSSDGKERFERRVGEQCLVCHAGRLSRPSPQARRVETGPFLEIGIGCERCHGPGKRHVEAQNQPNPPSADATIVNPARLAPEKRESVCNQCHLQGRFRVPRYGRTLTDFRPGQSLDEVLTTIVRVDAEKGSQGQAVSQVEELRESTCFRKSAGRLGCTTCHDVHATGGGHRDSLDISPTGRTTEAVARFYRGRCLECHAERGCSLPPDEQAKPPAENSCIHCHMPKVHPHDVAHTSQTSHRLVRFSKAATLNDEPSAKARLVVFGLEQAEQSPPTVRLEPWEVDRARAVALVHTPDPGPHSVQSRMLEGARLLEPVLEMVPDDVLALDALATASWNLGRKADSRRYWEQALKTEPRHELILQSLAALCYEGRDFPASLDYIERTFELDPWIAINYARKATMLGQLDRWPEAIEAAEKGVQLDPSLEFLHGWLMEAYQRVGRPDDSRRQRRLLERMRAAK